MQKQPNAINEALLSEVAAYIDTNYIAALHSIRQAPKRSGSFEMRVCSCDYLPTSAPSKPSLSELLSRIDDSFSVTLLKLIDLKGMTDVACYKKAGVSKQTWYKIQNERGYRPSKVTVLSFAIALELSLDETRHLLSTVGFSLSRSSKFDIIIEYFLLHETYDIFTINETLYHFDQPTLGA